MAVAGAKHAARSTAPNGGGWPLRLARKAALPHRSGGRRSSAFCVRCPLHPAGTQQKWLRQPVVRQTEGQRVFAAAAIPGMRLVGWLEEMRSSRRPRPSRPIASTTAPPVTNTSSAGSRAVRMISRGALAAAVSMIAQLTDEVALGPPEDGGETRRSRCLPSSLRSAAPSHSVTAEPISGSSTNRRSVAASTPRCAFTTAL